VENEVIDFFCFTCPDIPAGFSPAASPVQTLGHFDEQQTVIENQASGTRILINAPLTDSVTVTGYFSYFMPFRTETQLNRLRKKTENR
jgi:hypothetical protein